MHRGLVAALQGLNQPVAVLKQEDAVGKFNVFFWEPLQLGHKAAFCPDRMDDASGAV